MTLPFESASAAVEHFFAGLQAVSPTAVAVASGESSLGYGELLRRVDALARRIVSEDVRVLATILDNGADWIVTDLAALRAGVVHVPVPGFFTEAQRRHVLGVARVDTVITPAPGWQRLPAPPSASPIGTVKITFTSGSTGTPKGVCLDRLALLGVARGIADATAALAIGRHLCALPLSILLENVAGVYAPLVRGATIVAPATAAVGLQGSSQFEPAVLDAAVRRERAQSVVLLPQMLRAWTAWLEATHGVAPPSLRLVAVGGASVGAPAIDRARGVGLPACEGYGLSEGASVQTLNLPGADRPGSAGRALPHARIRIAADGEIEIGGPLFLGYLGDAGPTAARSSTMPADVRWWPTGDLGRIDADGFVHLRGRKKDLLITGFGRNVSPEWVERTLQDALPTAAPIGRAVVLGDGRPTLGAVLWPSAPAVRDDQLAAAVAVANAALPDYARIGRWIRARRPFDAASGFATANGRPRRAAVADAFLDELFQTQGAGTCPSSIG